MFEKCKKADILEKSGALICQARVNVGRSGEVLLVISRAASYKSNAVYKVMFYDPVLGRVTCRCRLSAAVPLPGGELFSLRCEIQEYLTQEQRRRNMKIDLGQNVMLHAVFQPGDPVPPPGYVVPATIVNISVGGVYLRSSLLLAAGRRVWFDLQLSSDRLTLSAQILRVENVFASPNQKLYGYGCQFVDMLSRDESLLRGFISQAAANQRR